MSLVGPEPSTLLCLLLFISFTGVRVQLTVHGGYIDFCISLIQLYPFQMLFCLTTFWQAAQPDMQVFEEPFAKTSTNESLSRTGVENHLLPTPGLRKRFVYVNLWQLEIWNQHDLISFSTLLYVMMLIVGQSGSLTRPGSNSEDRVHDNAEHDSSTPIKLDAAAQAHIKKHR